VQAASARAGFRVLVPGALPEPRAVHVAGGRVTLVYPGLLVTQLRGAGAPALLGKTAGPRTAVEPVTVRGRRGAFLSGAPHVVVYLDTEGIARRDPPRLAGNTLVLEHDGLVVRLEGRSLTKARALTVARSLRTPPRSRSPARRGMP
jgi:hypothetical protein